MFDSAQGSPARSPLTLLRGLVIVICSSVLALFGWYEWSLRVKVLSEAGSAATAQASYYIQHAEDTFEMADALLLGLANRLLGMPRAPFTIWSVNDTLAKQLRLSSRIRSVAVYDENGKQFVSSQSLISDWFSSLPAPALEWHRIHPSQILHIGDPLQEPKTTNWFIPVTRRLEKANGDFGGVLLATIPVAYFAEFYRPIEAETNRTIALFSAAGNLFARYPPSDDLIGRNFAQPYWRTSVSVQTRGAFQVPSPIDGVERVFGFANGSRYPVIEIVGIDKTALLSNWLRQAAMHAAWVIVLVATIFFAAHRLASLIKLRQVSERELAELARTDGLTGLANRRAFDEALEATSRNAAQADLPISLLLLDVDHFKAFNDTYGHQEGDRCLRALAIAMRSSVRGNEDVVARYGGEEFAILLPDTNAEDAFLVAERIVLAVRALGLVHRASSRSIVSVSIGCSTMNGADELDPGTVLVGEADRALYRAKLNGRDRVEPDLRREIALVACMPVSTVPAVSGPAERCMTMADRRG